MRSTAGRRSHWVPPNSALCWQCWSSPEAARCRCRRSSIHCGVRIHPPALSTWCGPTSGVSANCWSQIDRLATLVNFCRVSVTGTPWRSIDATLTYGVSRRSWPRYDGCDVPAPTLPSPIDWQTCCRSGVGRSPPIFLIWRPTHARWRLGCSGVPLWAGSRNWRRPMGWSPKPFLCWRKHW